MIVAHRLEQGPIACRLSFYLSKLPNLDWMRSGRIRVNAAPFRDPRNRSKFPDSSNDSCDHVAKEAASAASAPGDPVSLGVEDILNRVKFPVFGFGLEEGRASSASYPEIRSRRLETSLVIAVFLSLVSSGKCAPSNKRTLMLYSSPIFKRQNASKGTFVF
ncbi:unnamed protein product [Ixodes pacificus]